MDTDKIKVKSEGYIVFILKLQLNVQLKLDVCTSLCLLLPVSITVKAEWFVSI